MASGEGRADLGFLHCVRDPGQSVQMAHESMKRRKAFSSPVRKMSRSNFWSLRLTCLVHWKRSSGLSAVFSNRKMTAFLYSLKNCLHSDTEGRLGGQQAFLPYSLHPNMHFVRTQCETMIFFGLIHLKSSHPCFRNRISRDWEAFMVVLLSDINHSPQINTE